MEYGDRDNIVNGKYELNKTIIFPNTSLPRKGGNLNSGSKVKLLYNVNDPSQKFPNNIGIGFFLIPNGWHGHQSGFVNRPNIVYTDRVFNRHNPDPEGNIQVILLHDLVNSNNDQGQLLLGFEDIMRPAGDKDFNDLIKDLLRDF